MSPRVRIDIAHRIDFSDPHLWRALAWSLPLAALVGGLVMNFTAASVGGWAFPLGILAFAATLAASAALAMGIAHGSAAGATAFLLPSGGGTPSIKDYSYEKSLLARGRVDEAVAALNAHLAARPDDPALCSCSPTSTRVTWAMRRGRRSCSRASAASPARRRRMIIAPPRG